MSVYFAEVAAHSYGGGWAVADTPEKALRQARANVAETARTERGSYVLEFPDDADPTFGNSLDGGWRAKTYPTRVVSKHKTKATDAQLMGKE